MEQMNQLRTSMVEKARDEYEQFLAEMKQLSPEQVIEKAYEIVMKEEILLILEYSRFIDNTMIAVLATLDKPLAHLYTEWLMQENMIEEDIMITIHRVVNIREKDLFKDNEVVEDMLVDESICEERAGEESSDDEMEE